MVEGERARLEDLQAGVFMRGLGVSGTSRVLAVEWSGADAVRVTFENLDGGLQNRLIYRDEEHKLSVVSSGFFWSFDADGALLRLVTEAYRLKLGHHFDPYLALHTSLVEALPHQISAVYDLMLERHPLRFLLADDPGSGKTIMAGLLMKELISRGDLERCLVIAPGVLVEQWQDELGEKFNLDFSILSQDMLEHSRSGSVFNDFNHLICRLDVLARNDELQRVLFGSCDWDMIIVDEAHRMSASYFGNKVRDTRRYRLGRGLGDICRHLLFMTATPHNGKESDFQLFMALLDGDRFEGSFRDGCHVVDSSDMMRRLTKEELLEFDGSRLFPERHAYTVKYRLSPLESSLYEAVTSYVRYEMNRAQRFADRDARKRNSIGFALQILQRRLASSPAAIYRSLCRRRERLEQKLREAQLLLSEGGSDILSAGVVLGGVALGGVVLGDDLLGHLDEYGEDEVEALEERVLSSETAAEDLEHLEREVETLRGLERQAAAVLHSGLDTKWLELDKILDDDLMLDSHGVRRKLIIFTESRDTLEYLSSRIEKRFGRVENVAVIHGGVSRSDRRSIIHRFMQDKDLLVLVANDAAGEGVNLQRGHLMVNYDLPWNPNKIEQRFGRIHRIGQSEVCHLWNLVSGDTREGEVYGRLLEKLETARLALRGRVYDVLGELFEGTSLRDLLWDAIRYGDTVGVRDGLFEKIDVAVASDRVESLLKARKLTDDTLDGVSLDEIKLKVDLAAPHRLQPHHIQGFFMEAFVHLGGRFKKREDGRFELTHVPLRVREWGSLRGHRVPLGKRFERICFEKCYIPGPPIAEFICPGHGLLASVIGVICDSYGDLMRLGCCMVADADWSDELRAVFLVEHSIEDGLLTTSGLPQTISRRLQFVGIGESGDVCDVGLAPHLDLRAATPEELSFVAADLSAAWLSGDIESMVRDFAIGELARSHLDEIRERRLPEIAVTEIQVKSRLTREINYWDARAFDLKEAAKLGKPTRLSWQNAERRARDLVVRLEQRLEQLSQQRDLRATSPVVRGGFVVIARGLLMRRQRAGGGFSVAAAARRAVELKAMAAVMETERDLGYVPEDVSHKKCGYDILSVSRDGQQRRFIEVKGRASAADEVTITRNEIITSLNERERYILAIVLIDGEAVAVPRYVWEPFKVEPEFGMTKMQFDLAQLLQKAENPR